MKRKIMLLVIVILFSSCIVYHNVGWYKGDVLDYLKDNYIFNSSEVIDGEYLVSGEDEQGGFIIYKVINTKSEEQLVRIKVDFHRYFDRVGPDFKIKGISEIKSEDYKKEYLPK